MTRIATGRKTANNSGFWPRLCNVEFRGTDADPYLNRLIEPSFGFEKEIPKDSTTHPFALKSDQAEELNFRIRQVNVNGGHPYQLSGSYQRHQVTENPNSFPGDPTKYQAFPGVGIVSIEPELWPFTLQIGFPLDTRLQSLETGGFRPDGGFDPVLCDKWLYPTFGGIVSVVNDDGTDNRIETTAVIFAEGKECPFIRLEWWPRGSQFLFSTYGGWTAGIANTARTDTGAVAKFFDWGETPIYAYHNTLISPKLAKLRSDVIITGAEWETYGGKYDARTGLKVGEKRNPVLPAAL